jgi:hypothetical protein
MAKLTLVEYDANFTDGSDLSKMTAILTYDDNFVLRVPAAEFEENRKNYEEREDARDAKIAVLTVEVSELKGKLYKLEKASAK